jgi:hypothetical protein
MKTYSASEPGDWIHPDDSPPPIGKKIRIYTKGGTEIHGHWMNTPLYLLWQHLTKVKPEMKARLVAEGKLDWGD